MEREKEGKKEERAGGRGGGIKKEKTRAEYDQRAILLLPYRFFSLPRVLHFLFAASVGVFAAENRAAELPFDVSEDEQLKSDDR